MPELPEVETIRRVLEPQLRGRRILRAELLTPGVAAHPAAEDFCRAAGGQAFSAVNRRGKFLLLHLENGGDIVVHLRMTGQLLLTPPDISPEKHTHAVFYLDNGSQLRFSDMRRFGRLWLKRPGEPDTFTGICGLGPEPFDPDVDAAYLLRAFGRSRRPIKACLLDQSRIAGIGNIYADEILFSVRIHPARPAATLRQEEWARLAQAIPATLAYFIEKNAISPEEYLAERGKNYRNTPYLRVYGHAGSPCPACGAVLTRTVTGGRGTCFCPQCQAEPSSAAGTNAGQGRAARQRKEGTKND